MPVLLSTNLGDITFGSYSLVGCSMQTVKPMTTRVGEHKRIYLSVELQASRLKSAPSNNMVFKKIIKDCRFFIIIKRG